MQAGGEGSICDGYPVKVKDFYYFYQIFFNPIGCGRSSYGLFGSPPGLSPGSELPQLDVHVWPCFRPVYLYVGWQGGGAHA